MFVARHLVQMQVRIIIKNRIDKQQFAKLSFISAQDNSCVFGDQMSMKKERKKRKKEKNRRDWATQQRDSQRK